MRTGFAALVALVVVGFLTRVLPHPMNFTPVVAMTLLAGTFAPRAQRLAVALALPLAAMWLSDLVLNNTVYAGYYEGFTLFGSWGAYPALVAVALLPLLSRMRGDAGWGRLGLLGVGGALAFFLVSNALVWATSGTYPLDVAGLAACYAAGLPFFGNTLASTLLFGGAGVWALRGVEERGEELVAQQRAS